MLSVITLNVDRIYILLKGKDISLEEKNSNVCVAHLKPFFFNDKKSESNVKNGICMLN